MIPIPGLPFTPEFMAAYTAALERPKAEIKIEPGATRTKARSVDAAIAIYKSSIKFQQKRPKTKEQYLRMLDLLHRAYGDCLMSQFKRRDMQKVLDEEANTPTIAYRALSMMRNLTAIALHEEWIKVDPIAGMSVELPKSDGIPPWENEEVAQFETAYPLGTRERLAEALMINMASRREDVILLGRLNIRRGPDGEEIRYRQLKTGTWVNVPLLPQTKAAIDAMPPNDQPFFLLNDNGKPFTDAWFGKWFSAKCRAAGINRESENGLQPSAHGLRKVMCIRLAEAGCSEEQIAAVSGHLSPAEVKRYVRGARKKVMAREAIAKLRAAEAAGVFQNADVAGEQDVIQKCPTSEIKVSHRFASLDGMGTT
jgi:site-specific recombinase XerD